MKDRVKGGVLVLALALAPLGAAAQEAAAPAPVAGTPAPVAEAPAQPVQPTGIAPPAPDATLTAPAAEAPVEAPADAGVAPAEGAPVVETPVVEAVEVAAAENPLGHDLSPWGMYQAADVVVKSVMIGLAFASIVTWTIGLAKAFEILGAGARARRGLRILAESRDLVAADAAFGRSGGPVAAMVRAARGEAEDSAEAIRAGDVDGMLPRVSSHLSRIEAGAGRRLGIGAGFLATIGSTAPFVGLFGTVWGIMNSFIGIAESQTTNLAVVAPGIAEALLATALGLVAAIPAVVIYNLFARATANYKARLADAAAAVERLASRDLDHRRLVSGAHQDRAALARAAE